jgi:hypothetical protein
VQSPQQNYHADSPTLILKANFQRHYGQYLDRMEFYELGLRPGTHFIPFDPDIGRSGAGNLLSRLVWVNQHDSFAEAIAQRAKTFGSICLTEQSIDYFVRQLLRRYGQLLQGSIKKVFMIDLTSCLCSERMKRCKPSKLCKGVIKRCWGAWEYEKVR